MTHEEIDDLLNSMLFPDKSFRMKAVSKTKLTETDIDDLYDVVIDTYSCKTITKNFIEDKLKIIVEILNNRGYLGIKKKKQIDKTTGQPKLSKKGNKIYSITRPYLPFFVKQIIFYLTVLFLLKKLGTQKDFLDLINKKIGQITGYNDKGLSHNFFTRLKWTPEAYVAMKTTEYPEYPFNYQGQKHGELAVAINNLVYQAGNYDAFIDLFGGSGYVSAFIPKRDTADYIYNDINYYNYNLFKVLSDKVKFNNLIDCLDKFRDAVKYDVKYIDEKILNNAETLFYNRKVNKTNDEKIIYNRKYRTIRGDIQQALNSKNISYKLEDFLKLDNQTILNLLDNYNFGSNYSPLNVIKSWMWLRYSVIGMFRQKNLYRYYAYYYQMIQNGTVDLVKKNDVEYALASLVLFNIKTEKYHKDDANGIYNILAITKEKGKIDDIKSFFKTSYNNKLINFYNNINKVKGWNLDFKLLDQYLLSSNSNSGEVFLKLFRKQLGLKFDLNNILIYSDSPYIDTAGYKGLIKFVDSANKVQSGFKEINFELQDDMFQLISRLMFKNNYKFIFSCRACKKKNKKANDTIFGMFCFFELMLEKFPEYNLYVLVREERIKCYKNGTEIIDDKKTLADRLADGDKALEILITNFQIYPFISDKYKEKNTTFKSRFEVYEYNRFMKILDKNLIK